MAKKRKKPGMIVVLVNFQDNMPICLMDDELERPRGFSDFYEARGFVDGLRPDYRAECASICIVDIDTGETELL